MSVEAIKGRTDDAEAIQWKSVEIPGLGEVEYSVTTVSRSIQESGSRGVFDGMSETRVGGDRQGVIVERQQVVTRFMGKRGMVLTAVPTAENTAHMTVYDDEKMRLEANVNLPLSSSAMNSSPEQAATVIRAFGVVVRHLDTLPDTPRDPLLINLEQSS